VRSRSTSGAVPGRRVGGRRCVPRGPGLYDCRLGPHLQARLATWLDEGPTAHGWTHDQVWTAARVRTLIGRKFHLSYSVSGVTRLLHRMGFSVQVPARPAAERDEAAITVWREASPPSGRWRCPGGPTSSGPVRYRTVDGQQHPSSARHADAPPRPPPDQVDDAIHLYKLGWSLARFGDHLGVNHTIVLDLTRARTSRGPTGCSPLCTGTSACREVDWPVVRLRLWLPVRYVAA